MGHHRGRVGGPSELDRAVGTTCRAVRRHQFVVREPGLPAGSSAAVHRASRWRPATRRSPTPSSSSLACPRTGFERCSDSWYRHWIPSIPILSLTKGIEQDTLLRMTEVVVEEFPDGRLESGRSADRPQPGPRGHGGFSGGCRRGDGQTKRRQHPVQEAFMGPTFRVYRNDDVIGAELAGALKNVMAIAAGMAKGSGLRPQHARRSHHASPGRTHSTRRGARRPGRDVRRPGGNGRSDRHVPVRRLSATTGSAWRLAQGKRLDDIIGEMRMVAEGVKSARPILSLAATHAASTCRSQARWRTCSTMVPTPEKRSSTLMTREAKAEGG